MSSSRQRKSMDTVQNATSARDLKRKACDICKSRKVRCNGGSPCQTCLRSGVHCQYTLTHGRVAHLERRVASLQSHLHLFETTWKAFVPNIELAQAIHAVENQDTTNIPLPSIASEASSTSPVGYSPNVIDPTTGQVSSPQALQRDGEHETEPEAEQENADELNWDESLDIADAADGIGSLSLNARGIGYMGPQSGNALLQNLQSVSILYLPPQDDLAAKFPPTSGVSASTLQSTSFCNQCIDWYFQYYHCAYPILHEGYFRAQHLGAIPKPKDGSWPVLLHTVLAIGAFSSHLSNQNADLHFYREALRSLDWEILQRGTLSIVQTMALLANYLQKRNRPNTGFTLLGVAMNMAQAIGLHRELRGPSTSPFTMEIRRRVWWTLFIFDSGARVTFGRPTLGLGGINTRVPHNLDDRDLAVDLETLPPSRDVPTVTSSLLWQVKLAKIGNQANEELLRQQLPNSEVMMEINAQINGWTASLPHYMRANYSEPGFEIFTVPRMVLLWRSMHLRIVICRPFILSIVKQRQPLDFSDPKSPSSQCLTAADECVRSILDFWTHAPSHHGSLVWYSCYWLVTAVFVHVTCILYDPQHVLAMGWRQLIEESKTAFEDMGVFEPTARRAAQILEKIMELVPSSPDSTFLMLNEPVRMEATDFWNYSWADLVLPQEKNATDAI